MSETQTVIEILKQVLQLDDRASGMDDSTPMLGEMPEFDSMAVVSVLTALEEHYGFVIEDDEVSAEIFATVGSLSEFVAAKAQQ